jgi:hypothetical protein
VTHAVAWLAIAVALTLSCGKGERTVPPVAGIEEILAELRLDTYSPYMVYAPLDEQTVLYTHYRIVGTLSPTGVWTWSWSDPSVSDDFRVGRDALGELPSPFDAPACKASAAEIRALLTSLGSRLGATHFARLPDVLGTRFVILLRPSYVQSVPPPPP